MRGEGSWGRENSGYLEKRGEGKGKWFAATVFDYLASCPSGNHCFLNPSDSGKDPVPDPHFSVTRIPSHNTSFPY